MNWAIGVAAARDIRKIDMLASNGEREEVPLNEFVNRATPAASKMSRVLYAGAFSTWQAGSVDSYLHGLGMRLPYGCSSRHEILTMKADKGITVQVPTLALMRAFFKPNQFVLPAVFTSANIDLLSFVDYASTPPQVVVDDAACAKRLSKTVFGANQGQAIQWLQTSRSARNLAQSAYINALDGWLKISLPSGRVRMVFHGHLDGKNLHAIRATLISVAIPGHDSVTGVDEEFFFHAMADGNRRPTASVRMLKVPLHADGNSSITDEEWKEIEPMLQAKRNPNAVHSRREVLDIILHKLASGMSWKTVPRSGLAVTDLTSTFRRWASSGRLEKVLAQLEASREPVTQS